MALSYIGLAQALYRTRFHGDIFGGDYHASAFALHSLGLGRKQVGRLCYRLFGMDGQSVGLRLGLNEING